MSRRWSREWDRRTAAAAVERKAKTLEAKGISDPMWEALQTVHLARLQPARAHAAPPTQPQLQALERRGLVTWASMEGDLALWTTTPAGAAMMKEGRPE